MTETAMLDEGAVSEIEALLAQYNERYSDANRTLLSSRTAEGDTARNLTTDLRLKIATIDNVRALCATVKHLRDGSKQLSHEVEVETRRGDNWERRAKQMGRDVEALENERDGLRGRATELHNRISERNDRIVELQSQLEQLRADLAEEKRLRAELKQIAQIGISEVSSLGTTLKDNALTDFRLRAIQLCKDKAAEWERDGALLRVETPKVKALAAKEIAIDLEQL